MSAGDRKQNPGEPASPDDPEREEKIEQGVADAQIVVETVLAMIEGMLFNVRGASVEIQEAVRKLGDPALDVRLQRILQWVAEVEAASQKYLERPGKTS